MTATIPRHPAKYSKAVLAEFLRQIAAEAEREHRHLAVLDPCAGTGERLGALMDELGHIFVGVELQPEWAAAHPAVIEGDCRKMPAEWTGRYDVLATSVVYPNRMTDHHVATDPCRRCVGGVSRTLDPECNVCGGSGLSRRNTYTHALRESGAEPAAGSMVVMPWGPGYRAAATLALQEFVRVTRPGGLVLFNIKNHLVDGVEQRVAEWYLHAFVALRCYVRAVVPVQTPGNRQGANGHAKPDDTGTKRDTRAPAELVLVLRTPGGAS